MVFIYFFKTFLFTGEAGDDWEAERKLAILGNSSAVFDKCFFFLFGVFANRFGKVLLICNCDEGREANKYSLVHVELVSYVLNEPIELI